MAHESGRVALDEKERQLYVADPDDGVVLRYELKGDWTVPFAPAAPFEAPTAVVVAEGRVWVADRSVGVVFELSTSGKILARHAP